MFLRGRPGKTGAMVLDCHTSYVPVTQSQWDNFRTILQNGILQYRLAPNEDERHQCENEQN